MTPFTYESLLASLCPTMSSLFVSRECSTSSKINSDCDSLFSFELSPPFEMSKTGDTPLM